MMIGDGEERSRRRRNRKKRCEWALKAAARVRQAGSWISGEGEEGAT